MKKYTEDDLIYHSNGELSKCTKNVYILGFWKTMVTFGIKNEYKKWLKNLKDSISGLGVGLICSTNLIILIVTLPVFPFITIFLAWRKAVKEVREYE